MSQETKNYQYERNDFNTYGVRGKVATEVVANPTLAGTEANLTSLQIGDTKYKNATVFITPTAVDNGKVLGVSGGAWALVTPLTATQVGSEVSLV